MHFYCVFKEFVLKYFIHAGNSVVGIKYNNKNGVMSIGSYNRFETVIFTILHHICSYENISKYRKQPQRNKVRYDIKISLNKYCKIVEKLRESYVLQETKTLHRVMR